MKSPEHVRRLLLLGAAGITILTSGGILAVAPRPGNAQGNAKTIPVTFRMGYLTTREQNGQTIYSGSEGVVIKSEDSTFKTDRAVYNETTGVANAPGKVQLDDAQNTLTGNRGIAYYKRRDAEITGNIRIIARPKPSEGSASQSRVRREFKEPVTITCDKVVYNWRTRKAVLTGNLILKQKDRTVTATRGLYDGLAEQVDLVGNIRSVRPGGKEDIQVAGTDSRATAVLKEGAETFTVKADPKAPNDQNKIQGSVLVEEEEENPGQQTPPTTPPGQQTPPPPATGGATP